MAQHVTVCKKVVYANLPGLPSVDPCTGFYEFNSAPSCASSSIYYHCITSATACASLFVNQNRVCGKPLAPAAEDGQKHVCNSVFLTQLGTTVAGLDPQIRSVSSIGGSTVYTCNDNYCPASAPTLREYGICESKLQDCYKMSMKLTVKIAVGDYRYYCLEDPTLCN